jgi:hypothetical protein
MFPQPNRYDRETTSMRGMPIFMGDVPEYVVKGDHMHIIWRSLEIVLPVSVMLAGIGSARAAIAKWQVEQSDTVVELRRASH